MPDILKRVDSKVIAEDKIKGSKYVTYQFYSKDKKTMLDSEDISEIMEGLEKTFKNDKDVRFHIIGIHKTGEKQLKGFTEEWDSDEWIDYFKNKVKSYELFDSFFQVEITVEVPPQVKTKFQF